jgi:hypothetical protein
VFQIAARFGDSGLAWLRTLPARQFVFGGRPVTHTFPDDLLQALADSIEGDSEGAGIIFLLDMAGYDTTDPELCRAAHKQSHKRLHEYRAYHCALSRFIDARVTNEAIGKWLAGMPKSTVQAIGAGRMKETYTRAQKTGFVALLDHVESEIAAVRLALG